MNEDTIEKLREIGWLQWDPIGLREELKRTPSIQDEYDRYLLAAYEMAGSEGGFSKIVTYLLEIEKDYMGLGERPDSLLRFRETASAVVKIRTV